MLSFHLEQDSQSGSLQDESQQIHQDSSIVDQSQPMEESGELKDEMPPQEPISDSYQMEDENYSDHDFFYGELLFDEDQYI